MKCDAEAIRRIAQLAALDLNAAELERYAADIDAVLNWVAALDEVDVEGIEPQIGGGRAQMMMRPDVVTTQDSRPALFANAPEAEDDFFLVPRIIE